MRSNETKELRARAEAEGRALLERRWAPGRFELELVRESAPRWSHIFMRSHFAAFFRVLERVGSALVATSARGTRVTLTPPSAAPPGAREAPEPVLEHARRVGDEALRRAGHCGLVATRVAGAQAARVLGGEGHEVLVSGFVAAPEGLLQVELDAESREPLGWFVPPFLRGSREGAALGRLQAVRRATREERLPEGAVLARADLEPQAHGRIWRLRFDVRGPDRRGHVLVSAHARTGAVVGLARLLVTTGDLGPRTARERAEAVVAQALPDLLGPDAELCALVPGAVTRGGKRRAGWIGTATLADRRVARVAYADDEVEVALDGEAFRARVDIPAPA